eukprot:Clim_evm93s225 gene=Clim_evmTU93s225
MSNRIPDNQTALALTAVAALILFGTSADLCRTGNNDCDGRLAYGVAAGVIAFVLAGGLLAGGRYAPDVVTDQVHMAASAFLLFWGALTAGLLTSIDGPYPNTNTSANGYFSTWIMFFASVIYAFNNISYVRQGASLGAAYLNSLVGVILVASVICFSTAADTCNQTGVSCDDRLAFGVAAGVISTVVCLAVLGMARANPDMVANYALFISGFLAIWWAISAGVLTSPDDGPFASLGNGYFATWIAFFASIGYLAQSVLGDDAPVTMPGVQGGVGGGNTEGFSGASAPKVPENGEPHERFHDEEEGEAPAA